MYKRTSTGVPPEIKKKMETEMEGKEQTTDLTVQQLEENYWHTTKETKLDGSAMMMETRISKMMEATGKSREVCSKEVKARMKKAGSENTNTEDMEKEEKEVVEEVKEDITEETEETEKKDIIEIKKKKDRLDFLESFYKDNKEKEAINSARLDTLEASIQTYKDKEAKKLEETLEEKIATFSTDYLVPKEEIIKKLGDRKGKEGIAFVQDMEDIIGYAVKKEVEEEKTYDSADILTQMESNAAKMRTKLRHVD